MTVCELDGYDMCKSCKVCGAEIKRLCDKHKNKLAEEILRIINEE